MYIIAYSYKKSPEDFEVFQPNRFDTVFEAVKFKRKYMSYENNPYGKILIVRL